VKKKSALKLDQGPFPRRWLTVKEAAGYLGLKYKGLYNSLKARKIPFSRAKGIGIRLDRLALDRLLERNQTLPR